jgi:LPS-assembly lipoprotein
MRSARIPLCLALLGLTLLAACGWHPRGVETLPAALQQLRVQTEPEDPQFETRLERALRFSGIELSEQAGVFTLGLRLERPEPRNVALDRSARSAEQERRLTLHFALRNPSGDIVFGPRTLEASRIYAYDPNSVIAKLGEEALIDSELQDNLVAQVMRQLGRVDPALLK